VIGDGAGFTTMLVVTLHPIPNVYVTVAVPGATPVTRPLARSTVATLVLLQLQVPPIELFDNNDVLLAHIVVLPVIAGGAAVTVTIAVA
jgi:hypothetical protein